MTTKEFNSWVNPKLKCNAVRVGEWHPCMRTRTEKYRSMGMIVPANVASSRDKFPWPYTPTGKISKKYERFTRVKQLSNCITPEMQRQFEDHIINSGMQHIFDGEPEFQITFT